MAYCWFADSVVVVHLAPSYVILCNGFLAAVIFICFIMLFDAATRESTPLIAASDVASLIPF